MRLLALLAGLFMILSCYAYQIISMENEINRTQEEITQESLKLQEKLDARLPAKSQATAGKVTRHKIDPTNFSYSIFVIGDDALSHFWLKKNARHLEAIHALGFITNIDNTTHLQALQQLTTAPLLPANVDDLLSLLQEHHYPFVVHEGELWQ